MSLFPVNLPGFERYSAKTKICRIKSSIKTIINEATRSRTRGPALPPQIRSTAHSLGLLPDICSVSCLLGPMNNLYNYTVCTCIFFFCPDAVGGFTNVAAEQLISSDCSLQMNPEKILVPFFYLFIFFYLQLKLHSDDANLAFGGREKTHLGPQKRWI